MAEGLLIALIGTGGALLGSVVGSLTTYFVQTKLIAAKATRDTHRSLIERQLVALQELNLIIDFSYGNTGTTEGGPVQELFFSIIKETPKHLAFLPVSLREDGRTIMFQYFRGAREGKIDLDEKFLTDLRGRVIQAIDDTFKEYSEDA